MNPTDPKTDPHTSPPHPPADLPSQTTIPAEPFVESFLTATETELTTEAVGPVITETLTPAPPANDPPPSPAPQQKRSFLPVLVVLIILAGLAAAGVFFWPQIQSNLLNSNTPAPVAIATPSATIAPQVIADSSLIFLQNGDIWQGEQKLSSSSAITKYQYNSTQNYIVYIEGTKEQVVSGQTIINANKVNFLNLATKETKTLFELIPTSPLPPNLDYKLMIRDIGVSENGQLVAITTSDSVYIYDVVTQKLDLAYQTKLTSTDKVSLYAYAIPIFSPDNKLLLLTLGYYEGSGQAVFNLQTKELKNLGYSAYISGDKAVGWSGNNEMVLVTYTDQTADTVETTVSKIPVDTLQKTQIAKLPNGWVDIKVIGQNANMIGTSAEQTGMGQNNVPLIDRFHHIIKIDLATGQNTQMYKIQNQKAGTVESEVKSLAGLALSSDLQKLLVNVSIWRQPPATSQNDVYALDLATNAFNLVEENAVIY